MCVTEKVTKAVHFTFVMKKDELLADILFLKTNIHSVIQLIWSIIPSTGQPQKDIHLLCSFSALFDRWYLTLPVSAPYSQSTLPPLHMSQPCQPHFSNFVSKPELSL